VVKQFLNHIERNNLCKTTDKILLAVSGGIDSMVMFHLFKEAGFNFGVAHCNFQLRGEESLADEALVNNTCVENAIPFHHIRFNTDEYATEKKLSIQIAARELRYAFFQSIAEQHHYTKIATAHHLNDSLETVLLNLVRGTGIHGLTGIPISNTNVIRPMLFASRQQIENYGNFLKINWRDDQSNFSNDYQRNFIRNEIIPRLKTLNPNVEETFARTRERLTASALIQKDYVEKIKKQSWREVDNRIHIQKEAIKNSIAPALVLSELIKHFGFNFNQCGDIVDTHQPGKKFFTNSHSLIITNADYVISPLYRNVETSDVIVIDENTISVTRDDRTLTFKNVNISTFELRMADDIAQLDFNKVKFPLMWRVWKPGDAFIPLGMHESKKISDYLIDIKMPLFNKESVTVLESDGEIVWLVGHRINDRFKVTTATQSVLIIE
jgi:tRNA(Ile)-lysidine synthase